MGWYITLDHQVRISDIYLIMSFLWYGTRLDGTRLSYTPPPPISIYGYTNYLLKANSYTMLMYI